jgi:hypothetical protein
LQQGKVYYGIPWAQELVEAAADGFDDLVSLKIDICDLKPDEPAQPTQAISSNLNYELILLKFVAC